MDVNNNSPEQGFQRCGLAALSDLRNLEFQTIFSRLEREQDLFLDNYLSCRNKEYKWPLDPLHTWSRVWEYPYVYYHLKKQLAYFTKKSSAKIVDLGSGVTFFPFSLAKLGCNVSCLDIDTVCGPDIERIASSINLKPGKIDFRLILNGHLPIKDEGVDILYCVSVLEHIPDFESTILEVHRVLKPNGMFILTIDLDLCGYEEIGIKRYYDLRKCLAKYFDLKYPEITTHPLDILNTSNGLYPYRSYTVWQKAIFILKQLFKPLFGKKPLEAQFDFDLNIWGAVLIKKSS